MIQAEKASFPVSRLYDLLGVSRSGYYGWERRPPSVRALADAELTELIRDIHARARGVYGARRVHAELRMAHGIRVGRNRVERLMRKAGISGLVKRKRGRTTVRVQGVRVADDLVRREFRPASANLLWFADITYLRSPSVTSNAGISRTKKVSLTIMEPMPCGPVENDDPEAAVWDENSSWEMPQPDNSPGVELVDAATTEREELGLPVVNITAGVTDVEDSFSALNMIDAIVRHEVPLTAGWAAKALGIHSGWRWVSHNAIAEKFSKALVEFPSIRLERAK